MIPALMMTTVDSSTARLINKSEAAKKPEDITKSEKKIREAAQGFERTLLRQMLSVVRNSNISGIETKSSMSMAYLQMMDDQLADLLSKTNKIGFGEKMAEQLLEQANIKQLINSEKKAVNNKDEVVSPALNKYMRPNPLPIKN
jgi:Rod binding domain-containing protein